MSTQIEHVSDTALLVAASRAVETARPDGLVRDSFAARLAGERGMALLNAMSAPEWMTYGIAIRCHFMDELLMQVLAKGSVRTVLNLGAGLDTRPWRLSFPRELRWIEVDFPAMLEYKSAALANEQPKCRLERATADLNDEAQRRRVLELAAGEGGETLMITEGLLMYLPAATVQALAGEAIASAGFQFWLFDVVSTALMRIAHGVSLDRIQNVRAESYLEIEEILGVIEASGWRLADRRLTIADTRKFGDKRIQELLEARAARNEPPPSPPPEGDPSGFYVYEARR